MGFHHNSSRRTSKTIAISLTSKNIRRMERTKLFLCNWSEYKLCKSLFQVRLAKDRKKGEKIVSDSQERAYWRVHRPPPGYSSSLEPLPLKAGGSASTRKRRSSQDVKKEARLR